jgi:dTDP-4-dehydrorhamnose 3,5-epimerase
MPTTARSFPDVIHLQNPVFADRRGYFRVLWEDRLLAERGIAASFVQGNASGSERDVLRGLHYQVSVPQGKLVHVLRGEVYDVVVDVRRSSRTLGQWMAVPLSAERGDALYIPPGYAHGFLVLTDWADVLYKVTTPYAPALERTIRWDDPDIGIEWPVSLGAEPVLSEKDAAGTSFANAELID